MPELYGPFRVNMDNVEAKNVRKEVNKGTIGVPETVLNNETERRLSSDNEHSSVHQITTVPVVKQV